MTVSNYPDSNKTFLQKLVKNIIFTFFGLLFVLLVVLAFVILIVPILVYRWIITKIVVPKYHPTIQKILTGTSHCMASELLSDRIPSSTDVKPVLKPKKYTIVTTITISGTITFDQMKNVISKGWLTVKEGESKLKYPEFQQCIVNYAGFMFWKQDTDFSLKNHLYVHEIPEHYSNEECEKKFEKLVETLLNRTYPPNRSPWEVHVLQNYRNPNLQPNINVSTVLAFGHHHALMDGYSELYAVLDGLLGQKLASINVARPKSAVDKYDSLNVVERLSQRFIYPLWRSLYDMGYFVSLGLRYSSPSNRTPWHVTQSKEYVLKQLYGKSELIPVEKIKFIKNQLGVSFTSVILSSLGAGAAQSFKDKGFTGEYSFPLVLIVPLPIHPNKLENNVTASYFELVSYPNLDPVTRLRISEERFQDARYFSQLPTVFWWIAKLSSVLPASIGKYAQNEIAPAMVTNFSGPGKKMKWEEQEWLAADFCAGGMSGVNGVTFSIGSYYDKVRIGVAAEKTVMDKKDVENLINIIERELNVLYECANEYNK